MQATRVCASNRRRERWRTNVNEVTYLLISNELRLREFNESVQVSAFLLVTACVSQRERKGGRE